MAHSLDSGLPWSPVYTQIHVDVRIKSYGWSINHKVYNDKEKQVRCIFYNIHAWFSIISMSEIHVKRRNYVQGLYKILPWPSSNVYKTVLTVLYLRNIPLDKIFVLALTHFVFLVPELPQSKKKKKKKKKSANSLETFKETLYMISPKLFTCTVFYFVTLFFSTLW